MPHLQPTRVMTLGRLGVGPTWRTNFIQPPYVSPARPGNVMKHAFTSGLGRVVLRGLRGAADEILDPWATDQLSEASIPDTDGPLQNAVQAGPAPIVTPEDPDVITIPGVDYHPRMMQVRLAAGLALLSGAVSGYHGYKRERGSFGAAFGWFMLGTMFPIITPAVAFLSKPGFARARGRG